LISVEATMRKGGGDLEGVWKSGEKSRRLRLNRNQEKRVKHTLVGRARLLVTRLEEIIRLRTDVTPRIKIPKGRVFPSWKTSCNAQGTL